MGTLNWAKRGLIGAALVASVFALVFVIPEVGNKLSQLSKELSDTKVADLTAGQFFSLLFMGLLLANLTGRR
ncbi:MAG: hypothetical protein AAB597_02220 [Patescibacteria group bacterium]